MKSRKEEFDHLVRQHMQDADPGAGGWDVPSEKVWEAVAERIKPDKRRRWGVFWILGGTALLFTGILWMALQNDVLGDRPESPVQQQDTPSKEGIANPDVTPSSLSMQQHIPALRAETTSRSTDDKALEESRKPSTNKTTHHEYQVAIQATNQHQIQKEAPLSGQLNDHLLGDNTALNEPGIDISQASIQSSESPTSSFTQTLVSGNSELAHLVFLQTPAMLLHWNTDNIPQRDVTPLITAAKQRSTWSVAARLSPSLGSRRITVPDAQPRVRRSLLLQQEEPTIQPGFGLSVIHHVHPRWSLGLGLEYGSYILNGSSTQQLRYTRVGERLNARGNFENRLRLHLSTSYGELSTDVVVERSSDAQIEENRFISLALDTRHTMQELRIPLSVGYNLPVGQWKLSGYAGVSANIIIENTLVFRAVQSLNNEIVHTSTSRNVKLSEARNVVMGYHFGCALEIPLDRQWSILTGPSLSGSIEPVHENRHVKIYPMMMDVDLGVRYRF